MDESAQFRRRLQKSQEPMRYFPRKGSINASLARGLDLGNKAPFAYVLLLLCTDSQHAMQLQPPRASSEPKSAKQFQRPRASSMSFTPRRNQWRLSHPMSAKGPRHQRMTSGQMRQMRLAHIGPKLVNATRVAEYSQSFATFPEAGMATDVSRIANKASKS